MADSSTDLDRTSTAISNAIGEANRMTAQPHDVVVERPRARAAVAVFRGEHDLTTADRDRAVLESLIAENDLVVADFSEADFVDSSLLHTLVTSHRAASARGSTFRLQLGTAPVVKRAFELSGLLGMLECASSREEALRNGYRRA